MYRRSVAMQVYVYCDCSRLAGRLVVAVAAAVVLIDTEERRARDSAVLRGLHIFRADCTLTSLAIIPPS